MAVSWSNYANLKSQFEMFAFKKRYFFLFPTSYKNVSLMQQFTYLGRVWNVRNFFLKKKRYYFSVKKIIYYCQGFYVSCKLWIAMTRLCDFKNRSKYKKF
jgi:hypothetical protein